MTFTVSFIFNPRHWRFHYSNLKYVGAKVDFNGVFGPFVIDLFIPA